MRWESLPGGEDWLFRPAIKGMTDAAHIFDGAIDLYAVALMNDALDVMEENQALARRMNETRHGS